MFQQQECLLDPPFCGQVAGANTKEFRRSKDDVSASFRNVPHFRKYGIHHWFLDEIELIRSQQSGAKSESDAGDVHSSPVRGAGFVSRHRSIYHALGESFTLHETYFELGM
jgi:hypothetical protein